MNPTASKTIYLGRTRPLLHSAIDYLWSQWPVMESAEGKFWNLSTLLVVLPTARSARRLSTLLANKADENGCTVDRPRIITTGELPARLFQAELPIATEFEQTLAWARALADTADNELTALLSNLPPREPLTPWLELASTIGSLYSDLAAGELDFSTVEQEVTGDAEQKRWRLLGSLQDRYLHRLQLAGRVDPYWAGSEAIKKKHCYCSDDIVLIGTSDLARSVTSMLRAVVATNRIESPTFRDSVGEAGCVEAKRGTVTALIAAEETFRDHFDPFGSIIANQWIRYELPLRDDQLIATQDVADQARTAAEIVETWSESHSLNDVTIGVTHESLVGPIEFELRTRGIASYRELGWTISQTPIGRLLELLADHVARNTWRTLAALVRHADLYEFITTAISHGGSSMSSEARSIRGAKTSAGDDDIDWLTSFDELVANHYPTRCEHDLPPQAIEKYLPAIHVRDLIQNSLRDLRGSSRTLSDWTGRLAAWLTQIYFADPCSPTTQEESIAATSQNEFGASRSDQAIATVISFLVATQELEKSLDVKLSAAAAIEMLMTRLAQVRVADLTHRSTALSAVLGSESEAADGDRMTLCGWLDLALDDAPAMVITSLNHPYVPESVTADPFLPGSLRTRLQLNDNERRLARDIHSLDVILSSRKDIKLIIGARSLDGSPTPPSRLLAAAAPLDAARRLVKLLEPKQNTLKANGKPLKRGGSWLGNPGKSLPIPTLQKDKPVTSMSVTAFKAYLDCPYRFYLRHVLHLKPLDDASGEMQANQFGDLIHNTLDWFGKSTLKDATNQSTIEDALHATLDRYAAHFFGSATNAAVRLQIELARRRLSCVAAAQSARRRAGWCIYDVETPFGEEQSAGIMVDGQLMPIRGRIDRIDRHDDGRWAIIDYKTHGHPPRKKHIKMEDGVIRWVDLQLPLYQLLVPFVIKEPVATKEVSLSYFNIGDNASETKINDADFNDHEYSTAKDAINDCVRRIRQGDFAPADSVQYDDYSMILQTGSVAALFNRLINSDAEISV